MGQRDDPKTWRISRYSSLGYGVMIEDVLPSKGPSQCAYADRCPRYYRQYECAAGSRCPAEHTLLCEFISSATERYAYSKSWLTKDEYDQIIYDLGILSLQMARLSTRIAVEPPFGDDGSSDAVPEIGLAIGRYATALARRRSVLVHRLLDSDTAEYWDSV
ncbi:MAG: hypothetical protein Q7W51_04965 [Coriobacteriia bacterium]|nr:hypothetical protein [Coriobacteriia bacterium]